MKILVCGDFVVTDLHKSQISVDNSLVELFSNSFANIVNLEAPITFSENKILKTGPHLKGNINHTKKVLSELKINVATLANNHILDFGEKGVADTLSFCNSNKIITVGAGKDIEDASKILYLNSPEGKLGIVNFAENEWASASKTSYGANPMDLIDNVKKIQEAKLNSKFVIVIVHGGHEYYNLPSPRMKKQYQYYIDSGANIVIGHHTHCISGYEIYKGCPIYYSLGNFLFTKNNKRSDWYLGLVLELELSNEKIKANIHPISQHRETYSLELLKDSEKADVLNRISEYNNIINNDEYLGQAWLQYIDYKTKTYLFNWSITSFMPNKFIRNLFHKFNVRLFNKIGLSKFLNYMRCESHNDLSKEIINKYLQK